MKTFNSRLGAWALFASLLGSPFASILPAQTIIPLGEALDAPALVWLTAGNIPWNGEDVLTFDGADAAQSGAIPDSASSAISTTVTGPGTLTFWWKVSSEPNNDSLRFLLGSVEQARISGEVGWQQRTMIVPFGSLTLEWQYSKNASLAAGQDRAWLDQVQFEPSPPDFCGYVLYPYNRSHGYGATTGTVYVSTAPGCAWSVWNSNSWVTILSGANGLGNGEVVYTVAANKGMLPRSGNITIGNKKLSLTQVGHYAVSLPDDQSVALGDTVTFSVAVNGVPPFTFQWQFNGVDLADGGGISGATTTNLVLTNIQYTQGGHYRIVVVDSVTTNISASATLTVAPTSNTLPFAEALDTGSMYFWKTWSGSRGNWFGQTNTAHDAVDALECSGLAPGASANLQTKSGAPGILSFWWRSIFATPSDRLQFLIGNSQSAAVTNTMGWEQRTFDVPPGDVNLRWSFSNSSTGEQSKAWLDQVQFAPCDFALSPGSAFLIRNPLAYTGVVHLTAAVDCPWHVVNTNSWITILSSLTNRGNASVTYAVTANPTGVERDGNIVIAEQIYSIYQWVGPSNNVNISLAEALDTPLQWNTIGTPAWFGQALASRDGADAAQSGAVGDGGAVTATTTVNGPGTLFFWWKVSSETNKDYLKFFINGAQQTRISGERDWHLQSYNVTPGAGALKWTYSKNAEVAVGQDRGWLDQVQFIPTLATGVCVTAISPISVTHSASSETGFANVVAATACEWDVANSNSWITYLGGESNGLIRYSVSANNSKDHRTGVLSIGGRPFAVTQLNGLPPCTFSITPGSLAHSYVSSTGTVTVITQSDCEWNIVNTNSWITIVPGLTTGNGLLTYSTSSNNSSVGRNGQILIGGETFAVSQAGVPITLAEALDTVGTPLLWNTSGFGWFGQSSVNYDGVDAAKSSPITTVGGSSILSANVSGPGTLTFWWKVSSEPINAGLHFFLDDNEQVVISGEVDWQLWTMAIPAGTHNLQWYYWNDGDGSGGDCGWIDQVQFVPTGGCSVTLSPGNASFSSGSSTGSASVAAASDCSWGVFNTNSWITITSGPGGTGNGSVAYFVTNNPTTLVRSGNIQIADKLFLVTQSGAACTISISPTNRFHGYGSATNLVVVNTPSGCAWQVVETNSWINILSSTNNAGSGTLIYSLLPNTNVLARSGVVIIGGKDLVLTQSGGPWLQFTRGTETNGTLSVHGDAGKIYVVQCSEDLIHWIPISTNTASSTVTNVGNVPHRFYRTVEFP